MYDVLTCAAVIFYALGLFIIWDDDNPPDRIPWLTWPLCLAGLVIYLGYVIVVDQVTYKVQRWREREDV